VRLSLSARSKVSAIQHLSSGINNLIDEKQDLPGMKTNYYGKQLPPPSKIVPSHLLASGPGNMAIVK